MLLDPLAVARQLPCDILARMGVLAVPGLGLPPYRHQILGGR